MGTATMADVVVHMMKRVGRARGQVRLPVINNDPTTDYINANWCGRAAVFAILCKRAYDSVRDAGYVCFF